MRRTIIPLTLLLVFGVMFLASPAWAISPHFINNSLICIYQSNGNSIVFTASGTVAGLGTATDYVTLLGTAPISCTSSGKNGTQNTSAHHFGGSTPVVSTSNGNYPFSVTVAASCPGNQTASLTGSVDGELVLSSGNNATGTIFDTEGVTCLAQ